MNNNTIYALGFFDGVHLGHQALLAACRSLADAGSCFAGAVTFTSHPDTLVAGKTPALINTPEDRNMLLRQYHMDTVVQLPFDEQLMTMPWQDFICLLRQDFGAAGFVCGHDFRFGHKGEGNAEILMQYCRAAGLPCTVVPEQKLGGITISSSHIRQLLQSGDLETANRFLGHPHTLTGEVVAGRGIGRTMGIPTANLRIDSSICLPMCGVYACLAQLDGKSYAAVTNIGSRPTVGGHHITVEPWLLDFDGDLYGKQLTLEFHRYLRQEKKFDSLEQLQEEIQKNALQTRKIFEKC